MKNNKLKICIAILLIIIISMLSFLGVYSQKNNIYTNDIRDFNYSMDMSETLLLTLSLSDETYEQVTDSDGNKVTEDVSSLTDEELSAKGYTKETLEYNKEDLKNPENYNKARSVLEKRFKDAGYDDFKIRTNDEDGNLVIEIKNTAGRAKNLGAILGQGKFEIKDSKTDEVLLNNDQIKGVNVKYAQNNQSLTSPKTVVYLNFEFTSEGKKKLKEISQEYIKEDGAVTSDEAETLTGSSDDGTYYDGSDEMDYPMYDEEGNLISEDGSSGYYDENLNPISDDPNAIESDNIDEFRSDMTLSDQEDGIENESHLDSDEELERENSSDNSPLKIQKEIAIYLDNSKILTTSFDNVIEDGTFQLTYGQESNDSEEINENIKKAKKTAVLLNSGSLPLIYKVDNQVLLETNMDKDGFKPIIITISIFVALALAILMVKFKSNGILSSIGFVGFVALYLLVIRYTNSVVSISGTFAMTLVLILNYIFTYNYLNDLQNKNVVNKAKIHQEENKLLNNNILSNLLLFVPVIIICIDMIFIKSIQINSFGMLLFWGLIISFLYNYILGFQMIKLNQEDKLEKLDGGANE